MKASWNLPKNVVPAWNLRQLKLRETKVWSSHMEVAARVLDENALDPTTFIKMTMDGCHESRELSQLALPHAFPHETWRWLMHALQRGTVRRAVRGVWTKYWPESTTAVDSTRSFLSQPAQGEHRKDDWNIVGNLIQFFCWRLPEGHFRGCTAPICSPKSWKPASLLRQHGLELFQLKHLIYDMSFIRFIRFIILKSEVSPCMLKNHVTSCDIPRPKGVTFAQVLHIPEALWRLGTGCEPKLLVSCCG